MTRSERIQHYREHIYPHVEGWVDPDMWRAIEVAGDVLEDANVYGPVVEIGVHHGRFLFLIDAISVTHTIAVGIWDDPELRYATPGPGWDRLQSGALDAFKSNLERFVPDRVIKIIEADSFNLSLVAAPSSRPAMFLSIDAGHTPENVVNDLCVAQDHTAAGGIVALDDYLNPYWEGVTDGFYRFMRYHNRRLRPFMFFRNKLFLTTISEHRGYVRRFGERMAEWCDLRRVADHDCLVEKPR